MNDVKQDFAMKLGEGGEAFFVFETSDQIPEALQTSPLVSPVLTPRNLPEQGPASSELQEPEFLDLESESPKRRPSSLSKSVVEAPWLLGERRAQSYTGISENPLPSRVSLTMPGNITPVSGSPGSDAGRQLSSEWASAQPQRRVLERSVSDDALPISGRSNPQRSHDSETMLLQASPLLDPPSMNSYIPRPHSPPALPTKEAVDRAVALSKKLSISNIPTQVTETGDLMLDMTGYKSTEEEALRAESIARNILAEELKGNYDIGALIGADERGNLWIYSSEEAKEAASRRLNLQSSHPGLLLTSDAASDPGYQSDGERSASTEEAAESSKDKQQLQTGASSLMITPPHTPPDPATLAEPKQYAKTLRLTSEQLRSLGLKPGPNPMSFNVNKATCTAYMYYWKYSEPIVISDIDGTITK